MRPVDTFCVMELSKTRAWNLPFLRCNSGNCFDLRMLWRYHGELPVRYQFHIRHQAYRRKLWLRDVRDCDCNSNSAGNYGIVFGKWPRDAYRFWHRSPFCGSGARLPAFIGERDQVRKYENVKHDIKVFHCVSTLEMLKSCF